MSAAHICRDYAGRSHRTRCASHGEALAAFDAGHVERAQTLASESLELFERDSGPFHPDVANVLNCLARLHDARAEYHEAEACCRRSVDIMRRVRMQAQGLDIERLYVQSLTRLGDIERTFGRYVEAERCLREAIALAETSLGVEDEDLVTALNSLGVVFKYSGRFDEAAALYNRALQIAERNSGPEDPSLATLLHNVGGLEHARGEYAGGRLRRGNQWSSVSGRLAPTIRRLLPTSRRWPPSLTRRDVMTRPRRCTGAHWRFLSASTPRISTRLP